MKFHVKPVQWKLSCSMWTEERTDVTKPTVAFRNFAKAPKKCSYTDVLDVLLLEIYILRHVCSTAELQLSGLIETARRPDMQKIRIIGFFFENRLHW